MSRIHVIEKGTGRATRGEVERLCHVLPALKPALVRASILDAKALGEAMKGVDVVFHLAGQAGVKYCIENPIKAEEVNARGTLEVLQAVQGG